MKLARTDGAQGAWKMIVSRADALFVMIAAALAAGLTTVVTGSGILGYFTGPVTLTLPVATDHQKASGLALGATGHYTSLEATFPVLPSGPAAALAWSAGLNQVGVLAILVVLFLLAYRLRSEVLFTQRSGWIVAAGGAVLALVGTIGQILDGIGRSRLAEMVGANERVPGESYLFSVEFNTAPLMVGVVLLLVGGVFQFGGRLQKDTEGLV